MNEKSETREALKASELIVALQQSIERDGDHPMRVHELMELVFAGTRAHAEWKARQQIVLDIIRAKREADFPPDSVFFRDVWPQALAALKQCRAGVGDRASEIRHTIEERVEGTLFGDIRHREGNFLSVAADVLKMSQAEVDAELAAEAAAAAARHVHEFTGDPIGVCSCGARLVPREWSIAVEFGAGVSGADVAAAEPSAESDAVADASFLSTVCNLHLPDGQPATHTMERLNEIGRRLLEIGGVTRS